MVVSVIGLKHFKVPLATANLSRSALEPSRVARQEEKAVLPHETEGIRMAAEPGVAAIN